MANSKGPITLVSDLSDRRKRWQALALAWRSAAVSSIPPCAKCGRLAAWQAVEGGAYFCEDDKPSGDGEATKLKWRASLQRALELEEGLVED